MVTRKQHTVPQFYLNGFSRKSKAWASRKDGDGKFDNPFTTGVENLCSKRDYYEVKIGDMNSQAGTLQTNSIENWLSSLESALAPSLQAVRESPTTEALLYSVRDSLYQIKILLANLIMRNPMVLDSPRKASELLAHVLTKQKLITSEGLKIIDELGATPRDIAEYAILRMELQTKTEGSSMNDILSWLDNAGVLALRARAGSQFITADIPFAFGWDGTDKELPCHIYLPLDWRTSVIFHRYDQAFASRFANAFEVDFWNQVLITRNEPLTMAIAKSEGVLRRVTKACNVGWFG